jgi:hypothetical protein
MKLKADHKKAILEDFEYAAKMMKEVQTLEEKLFYFSSTFGVLSRIFNLNYDPQLVFMHQVLAGAHGTILNCIQGIKSGDKVIMIKEDFFDKLTRTVEELANTIKADKDTYDVLERIAVLSFFTTGNGYYLLRKGAAKIE